MKPVSARNTDFSLPPLAFQIAVNIQPPDFFPRTRSRLITGHFTILPRHMARATTRRDEGHLADSVGRSQKNIYTYLDLWLIYNIYKNYYTIMHRLKLSESLKNRRNTKTREETNGGQGCVIWDPQRKSS